MASNPKTVVVHQTLHGYDRGHHLLAGSLVLPALSARRLQIATDLSGPAVVRGFESYLTGYPLDESFYAIARTWYADEMPRPGCVWTQTLLLRLQDVGRLRSLAPVLHYFKRPILGASLEDYTRPLGVEITSRSVGDVFIDGRGPATIEALYSTADRPVFVPSSAASEMDALILALWQLHPAWLRRVFSFCTGALSVATADTARDLLVVPDALARRLRNEGVVIVDELSQPSPWVELVINHAVRQRERPRLRFLASDVARRRTSIRDVAEVMTAVDAANGHSASVSSVLQLTASRFPAPSEARQLKSVVLDPRRCYLAARATDRLRSLTLSDEVLTAFAPRPKVLKRLIQDAYRDEPHAVLKLAERLLNTSRTHAVLRGIVTSVTPRELSSGTSALVVETLRLSAKHSRNARLWALLGARGDDIVRAAADPQQCFPLHRWADVLTGILVSGAAVSVQRPLIDLMPASMTRDVLARTPLSNASPATRESLRDVLSAKPAVVHQLLERAPSGDWIELVIDILYARPAQYAPFIASLCRLTAAGGIAAADLYPFVAVLGLRETNPDLVPCILHAATQLHRNLAYQPSQRLQELAARELPSIGRHDDWDLCERLCHAIANRFVDGSWARERLFADIDDYNLLRSVLRVATYSKAGRRWLDRLRRAVLTRRIAVTQWQRRLVLN